MIAQSLSVVVPNKSCVNNCKFCVSHMHADTCKNQMDDNLPFFDLYLKDYLKRLDFAQRNGCNTVMLTGNSEPQQNRKFLTYFGLFMQMMRAPFDWVEMQTTGVLLDRNYLRFLRNHVGVNVISLSVSSFDDDENAEIIGIPESLHFSLEELCALIKEYDFTLRLSLNLSDAFNRFAPSADSLFRKCKELGADQVTLRVLYESGDESPQAKWVREHSCSRELLTNLWSYIVRHGEKLGYLPYGAARFSLDGMCVVTDEDCMSKGISNAKHTELPERGVYKYLILQPDCKLYSRWDDPASLIF